jgi:hypothetical protein
MAQVLYAMEVAPAADNQEQVVGNQYSTARLFAYTGPSG